jgi:hypothetical protein
MDDAGERDPIPPPSKDRRWDIDERGHGVADARRLAPRIGELARAVEVEDWIAEQPEMHLWPHLERAIEAVGSPWMSGAFTIDDDGTLVVELVHTTVDGDGARATVHADAFQLLGLVLEGATYVEIDQGASVDALVVDVVTGLLEDQTPFRGHGHTIRFRVRTA